MKEMAYYEVERMDTTDYGIYMMGGNNYYVEHVIVEAENEEEAIEKAKKAGYIVNKYVIKVGKKRAKKYLKERRQKCI